MNLNSLSLSRENTSEQNENVMLSNWNDTIETFDELDLKPDLLRGVFKMGFESPSNIQKLAILPMIKGLDVLVQAQAGAGKTAAFYIGALQRIDTSSDAIQALVLTPTRELATASTRFCRDIGEYLGVSVKTLTGGHRIEESRKDLENTVHVVVGTPGRLIDMINRKYISLTELRVLIIDEADEMPYRGFLETIKELMTHISESTQICFFSPTMPKEILQLANQFMKDPVKIIGKRDKLFFDSLRQFFIPLKEECKSEVLLNIFKTIEPDQAIIFCNTKKTVEEVTQQLKNKDFLVSSMHADTESSEREKIKKEFRSGVTRVLVTTDLLSHGIEVYQVPLAVNYDIPLQRENYIHRVGRTGRFGRKSTAISLMCPEDKDTLEDIKNFYDTSIEELSMDLSGIKLDC